jgi:hypothetical protein
VNHFNGLELLAWRSPFVIARFISSLTLCMVACLERLLRLLMPAIFSKLPNRYRRIRHLA